MPDDLQQFAAEIQDAAAKGGFNPFQLLAGEWRFHSAFLAPLSPALTAAIRRYLADGSGPLAGAADELRRQGAPADQAEAAARAMFANAQGMFVAVLAGDHGLSTVPQLFHGSMAPEWRTLALAAFADAAWKGEVAGAIDTLARLGQRGAAWPRLIAGPAVHDDGPDYWLELAAGLTETIENSPFPSARERLRDLGWWTADAIVRLGLRLDADDRAAAVRVAILGGDLERGGSWLLGLDEDSAAELLPALAEAGAAGGDPRPALGWLQQHRDRFPAYDGALAEVRLLAAAGAEGAELGPAVDRLVAANRKAARQDLTREPIWRVTAATGELLDTAAAAQVVGRSPAAIAKRLEQGTIPHCLHDGQLRLPDRALRAWKAALDAHKLLD